MAENEPLLSTTDALSAPENRQPPKSTWRSFFEKTRKGVRDRLQAVYGSKWTEVLYKHGMVTLGALVFAAAAIGLWEHGNDLRNLVDGLDKLGEQTPDADVATSTTPTEKVATVPTAPTEVVPQIPTGEDPLPGGAKELAGADVAEPEAPKEAPTVKHVSTDDYETAQLNLKQIAHEVPQGVEPTDSAVTSFKTALAAKLGINPWEIPDDAARDALMNGGYSDGGQSYEIWQNNNREEFYVTERPLDDKPALGEVSKPPLLELSDTTKDALITGTAVLEDPLTDDFAGENGYEPGTPEHKSWETINKFLVDHEQVYGDGWRETPTKLSEYLNRIGVYKT